MGGLMWMIISLCRGIAFSSVGFMTDSSRPIFSQSIFPLLLPKPIRYPKPKKIAAMTKKRRVVRNPFVIESLVQSTYYY
ncbi:hypothetical protein CCMA1212_009241 [Trichoderma ghanense]|uniref:Secreted protein n=1 Tax=Trichoderma ghanense TaxID=65468 RepID=A0ABY2GTQ6_9HYPO